MEWETEGAMLDCRRHGWVPKRASFRGDNLLLAHERAMEKVAVRIRATGSLACTQSTARTPD